MAIHGLHFGMHKPRLSHIVHDRRFWAGLVILIFSALLILAIVAGQRNPGEMSPVYPMHPFYWPVH